jgi:hypothetical protein
MDDLIRRSAANLLVISLALSADIDDGSQDRNQAAGTKASTFTSSQE